MAAGIGQLRYDAGAMADEIAAGRGRMPGGRPVKVGLHLPETERIAPWAEMAETCRLAEAVGFDSLWVPDHLLYRREGEPLEGPWECWSILAAVAAITSRVEIGPLVLCANFRNPALIAKMATTVDEISGGRLILGLGAGWHEPEFAAYGFPYEDRFARFLEAFSIIRALLRQGQIDHRGRFYTLRDCELLPRGPRPDGIPLMIGSRGPRLLRQTVAQADAWNGWGAWCGNRPEGLGELHTMVDEACQAAGRDPATLPRTLAVFVRVAGGFEPPNPAAPPLTGSSEELAEALCAFGRSGIDHLQVVLDPCTPAGVEAFAPVLDLLDRQTCAEGSPRP
jgi:alkanesulfonate monooxygenase SsuD/methylene tetrahydromethanopterin reductase-like flavin-dependent oxidoreductase (luciferase family)